MEKIVRDFGNVGAAKTTSMMDGPNVDKKVIKTPEEIVAELNAGSDKDHLIAFGGHTYKVREPQGSLHFKTAMLLPPDKSSNQILFSAIQSVLYISAIDGVAVAPPSTILEIEALMNKIGDEALLVIQMELQKLFPPSAEFKSRLETIQRAQNL